MKRIAVFLLLLTVFSAFFALNAVADEDIKDGLEDEYRDFFSSLPDNLREDLPHGALGEDSLADAEAIFEWNSIFSLLASTLGSQIKDVLPVFFSLCGILLLSAAVNAMRSALSPKFGEILSLCTGCAVCATAVLLQSGVLISAADYLSDLCTLVNALLPLTVSLYAAGGNVSAAGVSAGGFGIFLNLCENLLSKTVMPFCGICLAFALCACISKNINLRPLAGAIKRAYSTALGFVTTLFCAVLAAQNAIASGSDSLSMRAAKFVAGSAIPVLGGTVSESLKTLSTSIGVLRKSIGTVGIALIVILFLPILLSLLLMKTANGLASGFAALLGCERESALLAEISGVYGHVCAVLCLCSISFIFILTLLIGSVAVF